MITPSYVQCLYQSFPDSQFELETYMDWNLLILLMNIWLMQRVFFHKLLHHSQIYCGFLFCMEGIPELHVWEGTTDNIN